MCVSEMHHIDRSGGGGRDSDAHRERLGYDNRRLEAGDEAPGGTAPASGRPARSNTQPQGIAPRREGEEAGRSNDRPSEPNQGPGQGPGNVPPGGDKAPAPTQLNTPPAPAHKH